MNNKVTIFDDKLTVEFKSGAEIDVEQKKYIPQIGNGFCGGYILLDTKLVY